LPTWAYRKTAGRLLSKEADPPLLSESELDQDDALDEVIHLVTALNPNAEAKKRRTRAKRQ
jgi:hypothetical protein